MAPKKKTSRSVPTQQFNLWLWFKQTHLLVQIGLAGCAGLITYAGAVKAFHDLGWEKKLPASFEYVDSSIELAQGQVLSPLISIQSTLATNRLKDIDKQIRDLEIAMANESDPGKRAALAKDRNKLLKEQNEQETLLKDLAKQRPVSK